MIVILMIGMIVGAIFTTMSRTIRRRRGLAIDDVAELNRPRRRPGRLRATKLAIRAPVSPRRRTTRKNGTMHVSAKVDYAMRALLEISRARTVIATADQGRPLASSQADPRAVPRGDPPPVASGRDRGEPAWR